MSTQNHAPRNPTAAGATTAADASDGQWLLRQGGRSVPLRQALGSIVSDYQRRGASLELTQGGTMISVGAPVPAATAAEACATLLAALPVAWRSLRLRGQERPDAIPEILTHIPVDAVLAAARAAGLLPTGRLERWTPGLHLVLWSVVILAGVGFLAANQLPGEYLGLGWRLLYLWLASTALWAGLRWLGQLRAAQQMRGCLDVLRRGPEAARLQGFAEAVASSALAALPKPIAILVEVPARFDALSLAVLTQMRAGTGAAATGVVHWIVFTPEGDDDPAARALAGVSGNASAAATAMSTYALVGGGSTAPSTER